MQSQWPKPLQPKIPLHAFIGGPPSQLETQQSTTSSAAHLIHHQLLHHAIPAAGVTEQRKDLVLALFVQSELGAARAAHVKGITWNDHLGHPAGGDVGNDVLLWV